MNIVDRNFNTLVDIIRKSSLSEIYTSIRKSFAGIPLTTQTSLENYFKKFNYWGTLDKENANYEELYNRAKSLKEHLDDYIFLYNHLKDYRSKLVLFAIMNNWYQFDFITLGMVVERNFPHYFDLDVVKTSKDEVVVDLGAYTGDTVLDYLNYYGVENYKKIYCYEITDESFALLKNNLAFYPNIVFCKKAVMDQGGKLYLERSSVDNSANMVNAVSGEKEVIAVSLDEDIKEPITLLKMDIEGSEQKALLGAKEHIINDSPKLLISVYHNHEDLWKIPTMIHKFNPNYDYYLRYYGNNVFPTEIVLCAIPKN